MEGARSVQASRGNGPRRRTRRTADVIAHILVERPDARPAGIAAEAGMSERHVRRLLTLWSVGCGFGPEG